MTALVELDPVSRALEELRAGRPVIVVDDADRENEGDLIVAAELATAETVAFVVRHTSGYLCVSLPESEADRLGLPPMTAVNEDQRGTAYSVSVDARDGVTTGISATDRAHTIRLLAGAQTQRDDLSRPGHVVPLRARPGGVLDRAGHTEAAVDLCRLAGLVPAGLLAEVVSERHPGDMARLPELRDFATRHGLALISIADLIRHRRRHDVQVERVSQSPLATRWGSLTAVTFRDRTDDAELVALVVGDVADGEDVLVRLHPGCLFGDTFSSLLCDCGPQLSAALQAITTEGRGVLLYLPGNGCRLDARGFGSGAQALEQLGVRTTRLMTDDATHRVELEGQGLTVLATVPVAVTPAADNVEYLRTRGNRPGQTPPDLQQHAAASTGGGRLDDPGDWLARLYG